MRLGLISDLHADAGALERGNHDESAVRAARDEGERVWIAHGAPSRIDEYVFPDKVPRRLRRELRAAEADVLLLGHTHRPMVLRLGALWIVNPGSVTGARPRDSHTCATLDLPG
jgi:putative phosphoesterase